MMNGHKQNKRPLQFIRYLLFMLSLFSLTFAQSVSTSVALSPGGISGTLASKVAVGAPTDQGFAQTSVSVLRVAVSYTSDSDTHDLVYTVAWNGLGVLVNSSPKNTEPAAASTPNVQNSNNSPSNQAFSLFGIHIGLWIAGILALVVFDLLPLLTSQFIRPRLKRHRALNTDVATGDRRAQTLAQEFEQIDALEQAREEQQCSSEQQNFPLQQQPLHDKTAISQLPRELWHPNRNDMILANVNLSSNSRVTLSPPETGRHRRVLMVPTSLAQSSRILIPRVEFDIADRRAEINDSQLMEQEAREKPQDTSHHKRIHT